MSLFEDIIPEVVERVPNPLQIPHEQAEALKKEKRELKIRSLRKLPKKAKAPTVRNLAPRLQKYGMTYEDYHSLLKSQEGKCALCKEPFIESDTPHIDHCHTTFVVRGLLHSNCNTGLGLFRDDPRLLRLAAEYLESSNS